MLHRSAISVKGIKGSNSRGVWKVPIKNNAAVFEFCQVKKEFSPSSDSACPARHGWPGPGRSTLTGNLSHYSRLIQTMMSSVEVSLIQSSLK